MSQQLLTTDLNLLDLLLSKRVIDESTNCWLWTEGVTHICKVCNKIRGRRYQEIKKMKERVSISD